MREIAYFELVVGHIPATAEPDTVRLEIRGILPLSGVRYGEFRALRRDLPQKWEIAIPEETVYNGRLWALPTEFLRAEIEKIVSAHGLDVRNLTHVVHDVYRAIIVAPVWWKPPLPEPEPEPEPEEESEPDY